MKEFILDKLANENSISENQKSQILDFEKTKPFSLHWELKTLLYLGVVLLNVGLGVLIYEHIDTIGHQIVIALIAAVSGGCFWYAYKQKAPFSWEEVKNISVLSDYILLLGCLTFLIFEGYLQFQYNIFGNRYGLVTFIPMIIFLFVAYFFDHRGVLSMAITLFGSWLGITVTPLELLKNNDFNNSQLIYTGLILGTILCSWAFFSEYKNLKKHFSFTYLNFGANVLFICCLSGLMAMEEYLIFAPLLAILTTLFIYYAIRQSSFFFLTLGMIYGYVGLSYLILQIEIFQSILMLYYFVISCILLIVFLIKYRNILKLKDDK